MDLRSILHKYKFELNEISNSKKISLDRENNIYTAEINRITTKHNENLAELEKQKKVVNAQISAAMDKMESVKTELEKINLEIENHKGNKFKLREELLCNIHANNKLKKEVRRTNSVLNNQKQELEAKIQQHRAFINDYNDKRRQINEDYYNLQAEINETHERIKVLPENDRKIEILKEYLKELQNDQRANPTMRYDILDSEIRQVTDKIKVLEYQLQRHLNYMGQMQQNVVVTQQLFLSSYLEDAKIKIPQLINLQREKHQTITNIQNEIDNYTYQLKKLNDTRMPSDLKEQKDRAEIRLSIMSKRTCDDCDPIINELTAKILEIEKQIQTFGPSTVLKPAVINSDNNSVTENNNPVKTNNTEISGNGLSRKELERQRKLANQTM